MRTLIAANWKMHGEPSWAGKPKQFNAILPLSERMALDVLICPPTLYISAMASNDDGVAIGAQNCHHADSGAHTGEVSAKMIKEVGADYVIIGHSERRAAGETDKDVKAKAEAVYRHDLIPIICVGESLAEREEGEAEAVVSAQLLASMPDGEADIVIAYEPIWAIGTGKVPTLADIGAMHNYIRGLAPDGTRILYGGSVKPENAKEILSVDNVNGALIGGASLDMESLAAITRTALN